MRIATRVIVVALALMFVGFGIWALVDPFGFYNQIATYPPYNEHLFHDVGAFQIGIGSTLLLALIRRDALWVALLGTSVGTVLHAFSHIIDRDLGGKSTDPLLLSLVAVATLVATVMYGSLRKR
jgi:hypothetical protein